MTVERVKVKGTIPAYIALSVLVGIFIFSIFMAACAPKTEADHKREAMKKFNETPYKQAEVYKYKEVCIDGVVYIVLAVSDGISPKYNEDGKIETCLRTLE